MKRNGAIKIILNYLNEEDIALFTTGMISREAFDIKDRKANFYILGSMGLVSSVGLGVALNITKRVFIFDGDGSILMDMGALATIGSEAPSHLVHIVLDNESYQSTGEQPTVSKVVQLDRIAMNSGYAYSVKVNTAKKLKTVLKDIVNKKGPHFILVKVLERPDRIPERVNLSPSQIKERFRQFLRTN